MKKQYMTPVAEVIKLHAAASLLAGSNKVLNVVDGEETSGWADSRENDLDFEDSF